MHIFHTDGQTDGQKGEEQFPITVCDVYLNSHISCNSKILSASSYKQKSVQLPVATQTDVQH